MADAVEKFAMWVIALAVVVILAILGFGIWGFVELVQWITSK